MSFPCKPVFGSSRGIVSGPSSVFRVGTLQIGSTLFDVATSVVIESVADGQHRSILMEGEQDFFVAAQNGDEECSFRGKFSARLTPAPDDGLFEVSETVTIDGGTERFAGAGGHLQFEGSVDMTKGTWIGTTSGSICQLVPVRTR